MQVRPTRSYRCTLTPPEMPADQVEAAASAGALPFVQLQAPHADYARATAMAITGKRVHSVERMDGEEVAA